MRIRAVFPDTGIIFNPTSQTLYNIHQCFPLVVTYIPLRTRTVPLGSGLFNTAYQTMYVHQCCPLVVNYIILRTRTVPLRNGLFNTAFQDNSDVHQCFPLVVN